PALVTQYDQPEPSRYRQLTLSEDKDYLYISDYNYGLRIFSLADPANPIPVGGTVTACEGHHLWINDEGTCAYLDQTFGGSIHMIDIKDPLNPVKKGIYWDGEWNYQARLKGKDNHLYVSTGAALNIIDASNPKNPVKVNEFPNILNQSFKPVEVFNNHAFVFNLEIGSEGKYEPLLKIYNISDPAHPLLESTVNLPLENENYSAGQGGLFISDAYVTAAFSGAFIVIDVHDPQNPAIIGTLKDPRLSGQSYASGRHWVKNGYAYIINGENNTGRLFHIVDIFDPYNPKFVKTFTYPTYYWSRDVIVSGKYLYLGVYWGCLVVFDISNPENPQYIEDGWSLPFYGWHASWSMGRLFGEYLFLPTLSNLNVIDVPRDSEGLFGPVTVMANCNQEPVADAGDPYNGDEGASITFDASGSSDPDGDQLQYRWDFNNDEVWDTDWSNNATALFTWHDDYTGTATLEVSDGSLSSTDTAQVFIHNVTPNSNVGGPYAANEGAATTFSGSFTDPGADTHTIEWDFGDGASTTGALEATRTYSDNSTYTVTITVTDDDGGVGIDTTEVLVSNVAPTVDAGPEKTAECCLDEITFTGASCTFTDPGWLDTHTATINWGDNQVESGTLIEENNQPDSTGTVTGSHLYCSPGDYTVALSVTDKDNETGQDTTEVSIVDTISPDIFCPEEILIDCTRFSGSFIELRADAEDICDPQLKIENDYTLTGSDATGIYPIGITKVIFTATDDSENQNSCVTKIKVLWTPQSFAVYGEGGVHIKKDAMINGEVFSGDKLDLKESVIVEGAAFAYGDVEMKKEAVIEEGLFADGKIKGKGDYTLEGPVPVNLPVPPDFDSSSYHKFLEQAAAVPKKNVNKSTLTLESVVLLVNGNFQLKKGGVIHGPGIIAATGHIQIMEKATLTDGIVLIAGNHIEVKERVKAGNNNIFYAEKKLQIKEDVEIASGHLLCLGDIEIKDGSIFTGLIFGEGKIQIKEDVEIKGSVISLDEIEVKERTTITHDCSLIPFPMPF
ncbi:MAG: PKD domain-containing protein, partial [Deltaproteobacteria bacterium]|nr:PKD domain-containing protein [Deltaproteobacteria bacterium]